VPMTTPGLVGESRGIRPWVSIFVGKDSSRMEECGQLSLIYGGKITQLVLHLTKLIQGA
jgi:hypothetical protein